MTAKEEIMAHPEILIYGGLRLAAIILVCCAVVLAYWYFKHHRLGENR